MSPPDWRGLITALLQDGRIADALTFLQQHVQRVPRDVEARRQIARILLHLGQAEQALSELRSAARVQPRSDEIVYEIGVASLAAGQVEGAEQCFRKVLKHQPGHAESWYNLAWSLRRQNRLTEAADGYRQALRHDPGSATAAFNLGNVLVDDGLPAEAIAAFEQAARQVPDDPDILTNLGLACWRSGAADRGERHLREALALQPGHASACNLLGNLLVAMGRAEEALPIYHQGLDGNPADPLLLRNLALALRTLQRRSVAAEFIGHLLALYPTDVEGWNAAGTIALERDRLEEAETCLNRALALAPEHVDVLNNLGHLYAGRGETERAVDRFRRALEICPDNTSVHSNLLFYLSHCHTVSKAELIAAHRRFGEQVEERITPLPLPPPDDTANRRLRIGYVSPDFREHAVAFWFEPVLAHHDRQAFEITCYHTHPSQDAVTARFRDYVDHWRPIAHLDPASAARLIRDDGIDILVDLAGHSAHNGLPIFAYKPAPIQASFLGYPFTTGMRRIDYYITQKQADPVGSSEENYTETLCRLDDPPTFQPPPDAPPCIAPPVLRSGRIRFGALNRIHKMTAETASTWADILGAVPDSTLVVIVAGAGAAVTRQQITNLFAAHGVPSERLEIHDKMPLTDFLTLISGIDIALDPFPYGGGTTTLLTLWMGVPIVSIRSMGASGVTTGMLGIVGLRHLIARDPNHYREITVNLAGRPEELADLRRVLRGRMQASVVMRHAAFVGDLEEAYRQWWRDSRDQSQHFSR